MDLNSTLEEIEGHLTSHQFKNRLPKNLNLLGTNDVGKRIFKLLSHTEVMIDSIFDSNPKLWGNEFYGKTISQPIQDGTLTIVCAYNSKRVLQEVQFENAITWEEFLLNFEVPDALPWNCLSLNLKNFLANKEVYKMIYARCIDDLSRNEFLSQLKSRFFLNDTSLISQEPEYLVSKYVRLGKIDTVVDCGAFDGDTVETFCEIMPQAKVICVEPDLINFSRLMARFAYHPKVFLLNSLISENSGLSIFETSGTVTSASPFNINEQVSVNIIPNVTLDQLYELVPFDFVKMDIEGSESLALKGARKVIHSNKVTFAISSYHLETDIPDLMNFFGESYQFGFSAHAQRPWDSCFYAIPTIIL